MICWKLYLWLLKDSVTLINLLVLRLQALQWQWRGGGRICGSFHRPLTFKMGLWSGQSEVCDEHQLAIGRGGGGSTDGHHGYHVSAQNLRLRNNSAGLILRWNYQSLEVFVDAVVLIILVRIQIFFVEKEKTLVVSWSWSQQHLVCVCSDQLHACLFGVLL